jgi:DNA (cytosine-5)-methyltransferase 1
VSTGVSPTIYAVDLFCGAGGFSSGLALAAAELGLDLDLLAINHWQVAVETHSKNHPAARHLCQSIETVNPREAVPGGKLNLLLASPECTHFSSARGGKPMSEQRRATPWCILRWLDALDVESVVIENVPEFVTWGPLHPADHKDEKKRDRPVEKDKGKYFRNFVRNLQSLGYRVDWRVLNAADYGAATTRKRLFLLARKTRRPIRWPEPTHGKATGSVQGDLGLSAVRLPWRAAREIIDWELKGESIYERKRPLAPNTLARIMAGLEKFSGLPFIVGAGGPTNGGNPQSVESPLGALLTENHRALCEPFLVVLRNHADGRSLDEPVPALAANGTHVGIAEPFLVGFTHSKRENGCVYSADSPVPCVTTKAEVGIAEPFLVNMKGNSDAADINLPTPTITAGAPHLYAAEPYLVSVNHGPEARVRDLDRPLPAQTGKGTQALIEPFLIGQQSGAVARGVSGPGPTVAGAGAISLVEPFILPHQHGSSGLDNVRSIEVPLPSVTGTSSDMFLADPYLVDFYGERDGQAPRCRSVDDPLTTVAGSRTHGLAQPFLLRYSTKDRQSQSVHEPLGCVDTTDRYALVHPELVRSGQVQGEVVGYLDIRFRMLQPHELAAAMSFPETYTFTGNREQVVKQIGNAVDVSQAKALCGAVLKSFLGVTP